MENFEQPNEIEKTGNTREQERINAQAHIFEKMKARLGEVHIENFSLNGRERHIETYIDCIVASVQTKRKTAEAIHTEAVEEGDYRKEEFAAKLLALVEKEEELAILYAEAYSISPENAKMLEDITPGLHEVVQASEEMFAGMNKE